MVTNERTTDDGQPSEKKPARYVPFLGYTQEVKSIDTFQGIQERIECCKYRSWNIIRNVDSLCTIYGTYGIYCHVCTGSSIHFYFCIINVPFSTAH